MADVAAAMGRPLTRPIPSLSRSAYSPSIYSQTPRSEYSGASSVVSERYGYVTPGSASPVTSASFGSSSIQWKGNAPRTSTSSSYYSPRSRPASQTQMRLGSPFQSGSGLTASDILHPTPQRRTQGGETQFAAVRSLQQWQL